MSFAYLVYASSWIKYHEPAAFCAALLNAQPMGFWSPHTLCQDARRHGVEVRSPDLNASLASNAEPLEPSDDLAIPSRTDPGVVLQHVEESARRRRWQGRRRRVTWPCDWARVGAGDRRRPGRRDRGLPARRRALPRSWRISCGACRRSPSPTSRRWPRRACSTSASASTGGGRCGPSAPSPSRERVGLPGHRHRRAGAGPPVDDRRRGGGRRPVGHRCRPERASHDVPARRSSTSWVWSRRPGCGAASLANGCVSPVSSRTVNAR